MDVAPIESRHHRVHAQQPTDVLDGRVVFAPAKALWFSTMATTALIGGAATIDAKSLALFAVVTGAVLLFGHSLGSHRRLIHASFACPLWLEYVLVWCGVQVGLAGPIGLLRQHELRDYAQRLLTCHDYLRHDQPFWRDAWWQLFCELRLDRPPSIHLESRIAEDRFYRFLERTWMAQQLPPALMLYAWGGWSFVFWGTCARVTAGVLGHWLIGWFAHNAGGMHYVVDGAAVQGRNIRLTSLLTMGESWHNNHHAYPGSARLGLFAGEWDPGWWALMIFRKAGLAWDIRLPADLPPRPELRACDATAFSVGLGTGDREIARPAFASTFAACVAARWMVDRRNVSFVGPAAVLPAWMLQSIAGHRLHFHRETAARRVALQLPDGRIEGLPALCVALCARRLPLRAIGLALAPIAVAYEVTRSRLDIA